MLRNVLLAAMLLVALPVAGQHLNFEQASTQADAQRQRDPARTDAYAHVWAEFNNQQHLDERDGCYSKAEGELIQVLLIDASGKVIGYFANRDNGRSLCWRATYLGIVFPRPPFAPYWHKLIMH